MFQEITSQVFVENKPKTTGTAFAKGVAVWTQSGYVTPATGSSTVIKGVSNREITSTSKAIDGVTADYNTTTDLQIIVPTPSARFLADVTGGTITVTNVGTAYDTSSDGLSVNVGATTNKNWRLTSVVSTTKGIFSCITPEY